MRTHHPAFLLIPALLAVAACEKDSSPAPGPGTDPPPATLVHVRDVAGASPVEGVKIAVMDDLTNLPLAPAQRSDSTGTCDFGILPDVDRSLLVYGGDHWRSFGITETVGAPEPSGLVAPVASVGAPTELLVRVTPIPPAGGSHISGTVVDAVTGEPLGQVFLAPNPWIDGYLGGVGPSDDVTTSDGAFRVSEVVFAENPATGNPTQVTPLFISRQGYLPRAWRYEARRGEIIDNIVGVTIMLQPDEAAERGDVRGRLLRLGEPVPGIVVGLGTATAVTSKAGPGLTGWAAISDSNGVFVFTGLPVDRYVLHPAYLPGDDAFYPGTPDDPRFLVTAGGEFDAGDLQLVWEVEPLSPATGSLVPAASREFTWEAVPGAASYWFSLDGADPVAVDTTTYVLPGQRPLLPGNHFWLVGALDAGGTGIGTFGQYAEFQVPAEDGSR